MPENISVFYFLLTSEDEKIIIRYDLHVDRTDRMHEW